MAAVFGKRKMDICSKLQGVDRILVNFFEAVTIVSNVTNDGRCGILDLICQYLTMSRPLAYPLAVFLCVRR